MKNHQSLLMKMNMKLFYKKYESMIVNKLLLVQRIEPKIETKEDKKV